MATPPSSLPSPTPSTSSSQHPHSFSAMPPPPVPHRAPSASSTASMAKHEGHLSGHYPNASVSHETSPMYDNGMAYDPAFDPQHTPQPAGAYSQPYLPPLTSSPPPRVPPYIPPPQHAMAPDPIHSIAGMMQQGGGWQSGPSAWRGAGPSQMGQMSYPSGPPFRPGIPNGHHVGHHHQLPPNPLEPYSSRSSISGMTMGHAGRPHSAHDGSRERRRDRSSRDDGDDEEIITTIFVVGFPDDMQEREFQNMFTFSPGFEAATLKFPSGSGRAREPTAALLAELSQLAANQNAMGEHGEYALPPHLEEALAALSLGGTASTSASTTPSAAMSMTPSAPSGPMLGNQPYPPTRRQTIGFARFKTRPDALAARELLQGRKVDHLTGSTLKAEMAKKNLHTKRTTSGEELVGLLLRSGRLASLMGANQGPNLANGPGHPPQSLQQIPPPPQSAKDAWDAWPAQGEKEDKSLQPGPYFPLSSSFTSNTGPMPTSAQSTASTSPPASVTSPNTRPTDSKALLALAEEADELEGWSVGGAMGSVGMGIGLDGYPQRRAQNSGTSGMHASQQSLSQTQSQTQAQPINSPPHQQSSLASTLAMSGLGNGVSQSMGMYGRDTYGTSPPGGSDQLSETGRSMGTGANPADQNPPINTLYVGNLPAISPPTHPPNFLEESLRALFQQCGGFKRMSFRQKINGPMCFVEFEDVTFATQAIKDLYGHNLGGLVKGGIRLSYSKNSLGQRGSSHPAGINTSMFGGIAHTVALAGMSSNSNGPSGSNHIPASAGSYGLQLQHGQSPGSSSAPIPIQANGAATSLSPTAQPFTSPRSRYFGSSPGSLPTGPQSASTTSGRTDVYAYPNSANPLSSSASPSGSGGGGLNINGANGNGHPSGTNISNGNGNSNGSGNGQFSPMSSPIRTPASFSWVSSGPVGVGNGYGGGGYEGFGAGLGSLDGAASAWSAGGLTGQSTHSH